MANGINVQHFKKFLNQLECTGQPPQIQYKYRVFVQNEHGDVVYEAEGVGPNKKIAKGTAADKLIEVLQGDDKRNDSPDTPEFLREINFVSTLTVYCSQRKWKPPNYAEARKANSFVITCTVNGITATGKGVSKRSAKQLAAKKLLMNLQISPDEIQNTLKQGQNPSPPSQIATTTEVDLSKIWRPRAKPKLNPSQLRLNEDGVELIANAVTTEEMESMLSTIKEHIATYANEVNCENDEYMSCLSQWNQPSPVAESLKQCAMQLQQTVNNIAGEDLKLHKVGVINEGKSGSSHTMPAHQDVSFAIQDPFDIVFVIPLTTDSSPVQTLEFLPGSHHGPLCPPVKMYFPTFVDHTSNYWQQTATLLAIEPGSGVIFDSLTWYRGVGNQSDHAQFSLITQWKFMSSKQILPAEPFEGSNCWNNIDAISKVLNDGLNRVLKDKDEKEEEDVVTCLEKWKELITAGTMTPFNVNQQNAAASVHAFLIYYKSMIRHHASTINGQVFMDLWSNLAYPMLEWLKK